MKVPQTWQPKVRVHPHLGDKGVGEHVLQVKFHDLSDLLRLPVNNALRFSLDNLPTLHFQCGILLINGVL